MAAEYDIEKDHILIRDYSTEEKSDMNAFKDIYEKKESIISAKEQEIVLLKNEIEGIRNNEFEELKEWLKVRLDTETVEVSQR